MVNIIQNMKTALVLIPSTTEIYRVKYLQLCLENVMNEAYLPLCPMVYENLAAINISEFINNIMPMSDAVYMFVDYGLDQLMFDVIDRAVASNIELKYSRIGKVKIYDTEKTPFQILMRVCQKTGFSIQEICSKTRKRDIVDARFVYFRRSREKTGASLAVIGELVEKDHASVLHGIKEAQEKREVVTLYNKIYGKTEIKTSSLGESEENRVGESFNVEPIQRPVLPCRSMDPRESNIPATKSALRSVPARECCMPFGGG